MSINRRIDKEAVVYTYIQWNITFESVLVRWMNTEPVTQNEVSQKEKNKFLILCAYTESRKMVLMNLFAGQE